MVQWTETDPTMGIDEYVDWFNTDLTELEEPQRSRFVSVVAWGFMSLGALVLLVTAWSGAMVFMDMQNPGVLERMDGSFYLIMALSFGFVSTVGLLCFASGYGLRKRRSWGRLMASALLGLALVADVVWFLAFTSHFSVAWTSLPSGMMSVALKLYGLNIVLFALKGWVLYKLQTFQIKQECSPFAEWNV